MVVGLGWCGCGVVWRDGRCEAVEEFCDAETCYACSGADFEDSEGSGEGQGGESLGEVGCQVGA